MGPADLDQLLRTRGVSERVVEAMAGVPRDLFVPAEVRANAWEDRPLPIGFGQTISQPTLVGYMIDLLDVRPGARVLDIGTGSGYQAAVLARLGATVRSMERIDALAERATATLARLGLPVTVMRGDGTKGSPAGAPFDVIVIAATGQVVPPALLDQLAQPAPGRRGGRLLMPVRDGRSSSGQRLVLRERTASGFDERDLLAVSFVPLVTDRER